MPPRDGQSADAVYDAFRAHILPHLLGNTHPRFWGWVHGSGTPLGALAEFLAGSVNANLGGREHMPVHVERQIIDQCKAVFGFPAAASGLLVSGTSMATLLGLAVARGQGDPAAMRRRGLAADRPRLVGYCSAEGHNSADKAFELLGLGSAQLRRLPVGADGGLNLASLEGAIQADLEAGCRPFVVIATAGAVNTGAFDDLRGLRAIADRHGLWLHVDGAFGALAVLAPALAHLVDGIETADSLAFDFHKWLHVPYDAGCILIRDGALHEATFGGRLAAYLSSAEAGVASGEPWLCDFGIELSRGFRALKVWFTLQHYGLERLGRAIQRNCDQARYLAQRVENEPTLTLTTPVRLNIVCLRYVAQGLADADADALNVRLLTTLHLRGIAVPSLTRVDGRPVLRVCITNHRTETDDLDAFVDAISSIGAELATALGD